MPTHNSPSFAYAGIYSRTRIQRTPLGRKKKYVITEFYCTSQYKISHISGLCTMQIRLTTEQ